MRTYTVRVSEDTYDGAFVFRGLEAESKNQACAEAIRAYVTFCEEIELSTISAVATVERSVTNTQ